MKYRISNEQLGEFIAIVDESYNPDDYEPPDAPGYEHQLHKNFESICYNHLPDILADLKDLRHRMEGLEK